MNAQKVEIAINIASILISILPFVCRQRNIMSRAVNWCFTLNNYTDEQITRIKSLEPKVKYIIAGKEVGDSGTPHLQGFIQLRSRLRLNAVKELIGGNPHLEVSRNVPASIEYCKKENDYFEVGVHESGCGKRSDLDAFKEDVKNGMLSIKEIREKHSNIYAKFPRFVLEYVGDAIPDREMEMHPLVEWQQTLIQALNRPPNDRTIYFVVDRTGNKGKTWFAHYYKNLKDNVQIILPGKKADMAFCVDPTSRVIFIDAPRSKQGEYVQYDFLEELKNGYVFSSKYESRMKQLQKVHVVVMMNEEPDRTKLSADRYEIINI